MCGADCWPVSESRRIHLQNLRGHPDRSSWPVNIRTDFGSARKVRIVDVSWSWFSRPRRPKKRSRGNLVVLCSCAGFLLSACPSSPLSNSFFMCSLEVGFLPFLGSSTPAMLPVFLRSFANALLLYFASVKAGSDLTENGLLNGSERRKRSMATPRFISLMNFCKLTVCYLSCSQTCITSLVKHSVPKTLVKQKLTFTVAWQEQWKCFA